MDKCAGSPLLEAVNVYKSYPVQSGWAHSISALAVEGVSVQAWAGRTLAIAGESGCGKSTLGRLLLGLIEPDSGEIRFEGRPTRTLSGEASVEFRRSVQMVFQNPLGAFNPMLRVGSSMIDAMRLRKDLGRSSAKQGEAKRLAAQMALVPSVLECYPRQLSTGQLQRASIARALAASPRLIFLDEPTSALDASSCRQVLELLLNLQSKVGVGYVLVSHDFHAIRKLAHYLVIMYLGQIVEEGPAASVLEQPLHPYTQALLAASDSGPTRNSKAKLAGELVRLPEVNNGCRLSRRCTRAILGCENPQSLLPMLPQHFARCWRAMETIPSGRSLDKPSHSKSEEHST